MASAQALATKFRAPKYAALHLMLATWLRRYPVAQPYIYVTLGGTELKDIESMFFIDQPLIKRAISFEVHPERFKMACAARDRLTGIGRPVEVLRRDIFDYTREDDARHLFFWDLPGIFDIGYKESFKRMLRNGIVREGDTLFITSYLVERRGYAKAFEIFQSEFDALSITETKEKHACYNMAHPFFTLRRGLVDAGLSGEMSVVPIGFIDYRGTSHMGLYGYALEKGMTTFNSVVKSIPTFQILP